jgi:TonB family protein
VIAHIEAPILPDKTPSAADTPPSADKTPSNDKASSVDKTPSADKGQKPRPRPPARVVKAAPTKAKSDPETPPSRSERSDDRSASDGKSEVAKPDAPPPETPKTRAPEPAPAPPAARPEPPAGPRPGTIDVAATRAAARTQIGPVQQCYERARMDDPSLAGTVQVRITIGSDGTVVKVEIASSTLGAPAVENCIRQAVTRWRLPKPSGGVSASLTYPLVFQ